MSGISVRGRSSLLVLLLLALVVVSPAGGYESRVLTGPTSEFVGRPVTVFCEPTLPWAYGLYDPYVDEIELERYYCNPLRSLAGGQLVRPWRTAVGLVTLTHEAVHARGVVGEGRTECRALQEMDDMALLFGATPDVALALQALATPDSTNVLRFYGVLDRCRPNGAWDMSPGDGVWP